MNSRLAGLTLLWFPISLFIIMFAFDYEYFYQCLESSKYFDLFHSIANLIIMFIGYKKLVKAVNYSLIIAIISVFTVFQVFSWHIKGDDFVTLTPISETKHIAFKQSSGGGFTSTEYTNVVLYEEKLFGIFYKTMRKATIDRTKSIYVESISNKYIIVAWETFEGKEGYTKVRL